MCLNTYKHSISDLKKAIGDGCIAISTVHECLQVIEFLFLIDCHFTLELSHRPIKLSSNHTASASLATMTLEERTHIRTHLCNYICKDFLHDQYTLIPVDTISFIAETF